MFLKTECFISNDLVNKLSILILFLVGHFKTRYTGGVVVILFRNTPLPPKEFFILLYNPGLDWEISSDKKQSSTNFCQIHAISLTMTPLEIPYHILLNQPYPTSSPCHGLTPHLILHLFVCFLELVSQLTLTDHQFQLSQINISLASFNSRSRGDILKRLK